MRVLLRAGLGALVVVAIAGCAGAAPAPSSPASTSAASATEPESPAASGTSGAEACAPSSDAAAVDVTIAGFAFDPATAQAKIGDVVGWTNTDTAPHSAVVDGTSCQTETLANGDSGALVFNEAGRYAYHCGIHPQMKATVEVSG